MNHRAKELIAAYREQQGPDDDAVARLLGRRDAMGMPVVGPGVDDDLEHDLDLDLDLDLDDAAGATRTMRSAVTAPRWQTRTVTAVAALAAAAVLGWWIRGEVATPLDERDASLASDRAAAAATSGTAQRVGPAKTSTNRKPTDRSSPQPTTSAAAIEMTPIEETSPPHGGTTPPTAQTPRHKPTATRVGHLSPAPDIKQPTNEGQAATMHEDSLAAETRSIGQARSALSKGQPAQTLAILRVYEELFPEGMLREEADAIRTMAHCRLGPASAQTLRTSFLARHPRSLFRTQVSSGCTDATAAKEKIATE